MTSHAWMRDYVISEKAAPALGDLRACGQGQTIRIQAGATSRPDWPRLADALMCAVTRGANVIHITPTKEGG